MTGFSSRVVSFYRNYIKHVSIKGVQILSIQTTYSPEVATMSALASIAEQQTALVVTSPSFTSATGKVKKGPYVDLSNILVDHPAPFIRRTNDMPYKLHVYDIIELVGGQIGGTAHNTWAKIKKQYPEFKNHDTAIFEGELDRPACLSLSMSSQLIMDLPGNMAKKYRRLAADTVLEMIDSADGEFGRTWRAEKRARVQETKAQYAQQTSNVLVKKPAKQQSAFTAPPVFQSPLPLSKEDRVYNLLLEEAHKGHIPYPERNVTLTGTMKRPDFSWHLPNVVVCLEIDQHQHVGYNIDGEIIRELRIMASSPTKPLVMVRYNPDNLHTPNFQNNPTALVSMGRDYVLMYFLQDLFSKLQKNVPTSRFTKYKLFYGCGCIGNCDNIHKDEWDDGKTFVDSQLGLDWLYTITSPLAKTQ